MIGRLIEWHVMNMHWQWGDTQRRRSTKVRCSGGHWRWCGTAAVQIYSRKVGDLLEKRNKSMSGHLSGDIADDTAEETGHFWNEYSNDVAEHWAHGLQPSFLFLLSGSASQLLIVIATGIADVRTNEVLLQYWRHVFRRGLFRVLHSTLCLQLGRTVIFLFLGLCQAGKERQRENQSNEHCLGQGRRSGTVWVGLIGRLWGGGSFGRLLTVTHFVVVALGENTVTVALGTQTEQWGDWEQFKVWTAAVGEKTVLVKSTM